MYDKNATVLSDNVLQKVGRSLSLISSLEIGSRGGDPDSAAVRNKALLPGSAQLQNPFSAEGPITAEDLRAYKVLSDLLWPSREIRLPLVRQEGRMLILIQTFQTHKNLKEI